MIKTKKERKCLLCKTKIISKHFGHRHCDKCNKLLENHSKAGFILRKPCKYYPNSTTEY